MTNPQDLIGKRQIKFRAWDPKAVQMYSINDVKLTHLPSEVTFDYFFHPDEVQMQYTGMKDKNGKEIYEGDVLKGYGENWYVTFDEVEDSDGYAQQYTYGWKITSKKDSMALENSYDYEVIGNLFENPELLD